MRLSQPMQRTISVTSYLKMASRASISLRVAIAHSTATSPECIKKAGLNPGRGLRPKKGVYPSIIKNNPKRESCVIL